jgi:hypothetical protein
MFKLFTFLLIPTFTFAQFTIKGKLVDNNNPSENIEVILYQTDDKPIKSVLSDNNGNFELQTAKGNYIIKGRLLGKELFVKDINVEENINIGTINISQTENLQEVTVTSQKKLIERKIDRLVFNVENSSKSTSGDAMEVLKITPGIRVRNDRIDMIGKSTMQVMVNDKLINISGNDLVNYLSSIPSQDIKNIEVITIPPSKYDASGNSGIININLKKATNDSWNGRLWSTYRQRRYPFGSFGGGFNYNKKKLSINSSFNYRNGIYYQEQEDDIFFPNDIWKMSSPFKSTSKGGSGRIDINYQITPVWSIGSQYVYNKTNTEFRDKPETKVYDNITNSILRTLSSNGSIISKSVMNSVNVNNVFQLKKLKRKISLDFDYFSFINNETSEYNGNQVIIQPYSEKFYNGLNNNDQEVSNFSISLDFDFPLDSAKLNFGGKTSNSESINDISFFNSDLVSLPFQYLPLSFTDFKYSENVQALYFSIDKNLGKKITLKGGIRMEATQTISESKLLNFNSNVNYVKFFPTFYASFDMNENSKFLLSYSKRIQRPRFIDMNPNVIYTNPFQSIEGNAFLQPAFIDNIEFTYTYKDFDSKLYYSYEDNLFSQIYFPNTETNFIKYTNLNYIDTHRFGITESYLKIFFEWWSSNNSVNFNYTISKFNINPSIAEQKGYNTTFSTNNDIVFNKEKTFLGSINFYYDLPGVDGIFNKKSASSLSLMFKYFMLKKNLSFTLSANDIFRGSIERRESMVNNVLQRSNYYYDNQSFQLNINYKFGNNKLKTKANQTGNNSEKERIN